jgi:hypothetical protein
MLSMRRHALFISLAMLAATALAEPAWPTIDAPAGAHVQQVAGDLVVNGQHSHVSRLDMAGTEDAVLEFYRNRFGARRVENRVGDARVIAARQGDCFVTVRVQSPLAGEVQATIIATRIGGALSHSKVTLETEAMLPAGSAVLQTQESDDNGVPALMLMAANRVGVQANRDALVDQLRARGFRIVREDANQAGGRELMSLSLVSSTEDASITVTDAGAYRSLLIQRSRRPR